MDVINLIYLLKQLQDHFAVIKLSVNTTLIRAISDTTRRVPYLLFIQIGMYETIKLPMVPLISDRQKTPSGNGTKNDWVQDQHLAVNYYIGIAILVLSSSIM